MTWKWCKCLACGFHGELMQFCAIFGEHRCPKCGSDNAEEEDESHYRERCNQEAARYHVPTLNKSQEPKR